MQLIWNGKDISSFVTITGCVYHEAAQGRCNSLDITFDRAKLWYQWNPQIDDTIELIGAEIATGKMFFHVLLPYMDGYRLIAVSMPSTAKQRLWKSYEELTISAIIGQNAAESGMGFRLFGVSGGTMYKYALRNNSGAAKYINDIGQREGFMTMAYNGAFRCVDILWAQGQATVRKITITDQQENVHYIHNGGDKWKSLTVKSLFAEAMAVDGAAKSTDAQVMSDLPAINTAEAGRWARNLLLWHNRLCETLTIAEDLNKVMSANVRISVDGGTAADGEWLVDTVEHDIYNKRTRSVLVRCVTSVG